MNKDIKIIQVCFNVMDPHQRQQYERAASFPNRSGYVKRLIQRDMDCGQGLPVQTPQTAVMGSTIDFQAEAFI